LYIPYQASLTGGLWRPRQSEGSSGLGGKVAAVLCPALHGIAEDFAGTGQFFSPTSPAMIRDRQIQ